MSRLPYRSLSISQNFLHSGALVDRLLAVSSIRPGDLVYDLGAGKGLITDRLARWGCQVVAVELDFELAVQLRASFVDVPVVRVSESDVLAVPFPRRPYKVFASIPFNATAAIVHRLSRVPNPPDDSYLVVQAEAAQRFTGQPRGTLISALLKPWFEPTIVHRFSRSDFAPPPRVEVVMLRLRKRGPPLVQSADARGYRDFMVSVFAGRHGTIDATLRALMGSRRARRVETQLALDRAASPSALTFASWLDLFNIWRDTAPLPARSGLAGAERRLVHRQQRLRKSHRTSRFSNPTLVIECRPPPSVRRVLPPAGADRRHPPRSCCALRMSRTIPAVSAPRPTRVQVP
jgi:23S rRNA (adenine-N6)-dimethyltransferase